MKKFLIKPQIVQFDTFKEFAEEFKLGKDDLIFTNEYIYEPFMAKLNLPCGHIFQEKYGAGEPTDVMIDAILEEMNKGDYKRIVAVGGGTIIDIAKVMALKDAKNVDDFYEGVTPVVKGKELIIIPTTCGTGSEVTNIAIVNRTKRNTKMGLVSMDMYADYAALIPEFLSSLPYGVFATSAIDALIHCIEAYLNPNNNEFIEMFAIRGIEMIMGCFKDIVENGQDRRFIHSETMLVASCFGGIAFGNNGCGAVHAISYALGAKYHVPHGESNYQFLIEVMQAYEKKAPGGKMAATKEILAKVMGISANDDVFAKLDELLNKFIVKKRMTDFGATAEDVEEFADSTVANQQRLLNNNYVPLSRDEIRDIYASRM